MTPTSQWQFGLILAYLLPGFISLAGMAPLVPAVARWLSPLPNASLDVAPTVYAVLAAITAGMILSCFRWLLIDRVHFYMGIKRPAWNDRGLQESLQGFDYLVQNHFRYYEFCGNTLLALLWAYGLNRALGTSPLFGFATDFGILIVLVVLFAASRDALVKYYNRTTSLLGQVAEKQESGEKMFNGNDHGPVAKSTQRPRPQNKPQDKPKAAGPSQPAQNSGDKKSK